MKESGKSFNLEKEMTPITENYFQSKGFKVKKEVITSEGVCDLIAIKFNNASIESRLKLGIKSHLSNDLQVHIWALTSSKSFTFEKLCKMFNAFGIDKDQIETELKKLIDKKLINYNDNKELVGTRGWHPLTTDLISIELKLHNFYEALSQARRYKEFSTQTYIGLPANSTDKLNDEKLNELKSEGIGLLRISDDEIRVVIESPIKKPINISQFTQSIRISEIFWKDYLKTIKH